MAVDRSREYPHRGYHETITLISAQPGRGCATADLPLRDALLASP